MKSDVLGVKIDNVDMKNAVSRVLAYTKDKGCRMVFTPNAEMVMAAAKNPSLMDVLNSSDMTVPDGAGVVLGARLLRMPVKEKVAGIDLIKSVFSTGEKLSVFLYGSAPGVAEKASENITKTYTNITVCGTEHGYRETNYSTDLVKKINSLEPDIILVALGVPAQEMWISKNSKNLLAGVAIGCGGTLDVLSGNVKRAPDWMIKLSLEWLYRLVKQPKRFGRMMQIPLFLLLCLKKRITGSLKAVSF